MLRNFRSLTSRKVLPAVLIAPFFLSGCFTVEIRELKTKNEMLQQRIHQLQQDRTALEEMLLAETRERERAHQEVIRLQNELRSMQEQLESARAKLDAARLSLSTSTDSQAREFAQRMEDALQHEAALQAELDKTRDALASVEVELLEHQQVRQELESDLEVALTHLDKNTSLIDEMSSSLEETRSERMDLASRLEETSKQAETHGSAARMYQDKLRAAETELQNTRDKLESIQGEVSTLQESLASAPIGDAAAALSAADFARNALAASIAAGQATVIQDGGRVRLVLFSDSLFDSGTTLISDTGLKSIKGVEEVIRNTTPTYIVVEGHTDNVPVRNMPYPDNWELGAARATEVVRNLATKKGINAGNMVAQSRSWFDPMEKNSEAAGRQKNRRVEIVLEFLPTQPKV